MATKYPKIRNRGLLGALILVAVAPWSLAQAGKSIMERRSADPHGVVEIVNLAGSVEVAAWDRPEVEVSGTAEGESGVVEVVTEGNRTLIRIAPKSGMGHGSEANVLVRVPATSSLTATMVSSDFKIRGVRGDVKLQSMSGDISGVVDGDLRVSTVSGSVRMTAHDVHRVEVKTISGDVQLNGGGGELETTTVSGTVNVDFGTLTRARFKSISGDLTARLTLAPDGEMDGESVSGDIHVEFGAAPKAEFDVRTYSGDIHSCFGPAPETSRHGPGSRLAFDTPGGHSSVRIETKSGDVGLCTPGAKDKQASSDRRHPGE